MGGSGLWVKVRLRLWVRLMGYGRIGVMGYGLWVRVRVRLSNTARGWRTFSSRVMGYG